MAYLKLKIGNNEEIRIRTMIITKNNLNRKNGEHEKSETVKIYFCGYAIWYISTVWWV